MKSKSIFETRAKFLMPGIKAQRECGGGRIMLGDNTDSRAVMLWPVKFHCVWVSISTGFPCIVYHMQTQFRLAPKLPERNYSLSQGVFLVTEDG